MADALPGVANTRAATMVKSDGTNITAGTVNFYLLALTGANAGKWFRGSDSSWQAAESVAAAGAHKGRGHWSASIAAAAWIDGVTYRLYAAESDGLSIAYGYDVYCGATLMSLVVDGAVSVATLFKRMNAYVRGKIGKTGDAYSYKAEDGNTEVINNTISEDGRNT